MTRGGSSNGAERYPRFPDGFGPWKSGPLLTIIPCTAKVIYEGQRSSHSLDGKSRILFLAERGSGSWKSDSG
jgi:hypothetical protein